MLRAYAWIMSLGADGLREAAEISVLNNNYLMNKVLEIQGVGYRAEAKPFGITLIVGYSHTVDYKAPEGIKISVDNNTDGTPELEALKFEDFVVYRNDTTNDNLSYVSLWRLTAVRWDGDSDGEADAHHFKVEGYIMQDEDQDGTPEVTWHIVYEGNGEEEEP